MPTYIPIELPRPVKASDCTIIAMRWPRGGLQVDIGVKDGKSLRVSVEGFLGIRTLNKVPLMDRETDDTTGIRPDHLFYEVKFASFMRNTISVQYMAFSSARHYRIITMHESLDIISVMPPVVTEWHGSPTDG